MTPARNARGLFVAYLRPHRGAVGALVVALVAATVLPLVGPQLLRRFVDDAAAGRPVAVLVRTAVAYLAVMLAAHGVRIFAAYRASRLAWVSANRLREDLVEHLLSLDLSFHAERTPGELIERVDGDVTALSELLSRFLFQIAAAALLLAGTVVVVAREDVRLGLALVVLLVVSLAALARLQQLAVPAAAADREAAAQLTGYVEERLAGAEELRALGAADHALYRFHEVSARAHRANARWERRSGALLALTHLVSTGGTALMLVFGIVLLGRGKATVGTVVLLFQYTTMVRRPLEQVVQQFKEVQRAAAGARRVLELLAHRPTIVERPGAVALPAGGPLGLRLHRLTFSYGDGEPVLRDVSLTLAPGRSLGLVGRTGSGKSTIARLLLRLYDPPPGSVTIGGVDVRDVQLASLRRQVRLVSQDVQLFSADLRSNLTLFEQVDDDERLVAVLEELGLGEWFRSLADGLDTVLGPGGRGVSAGEAQLIAFARVFLADPGVVVLDEASSRLDPATEALVERAVARLLEGRTAVVIAHRLSSLEQVDDIAVLDHGRVVEHGARVELAADPSTRFARLRGLTTVGARP